MYYLTSIDGCGHAELENELRYFFNRLRQVRRRLNQERSALSLNRIQRSRCKQNLLDLEVMERDFYALSHKEDIRHLYRKVQRFVKLDQERLMHTFGQETISCRSMFLAL
ncbi:hypothetical protein YH65_03725 [Sulfurovum lithotrophicum]|uniref:Uncharacterized protein n=1 Tax=Sulfurovum lithotrophicum TaxID=206403 RepID=A0A7U4M0L5_9BACT|nr:hypothetical protein [Sulfurovum lithotrophicum]AKF24597.1 hypothetical protein YH65_03725 [Sulfurovum lithotrophicum]